MLKYFSRQLNRQILLTISLITPLCSVAWAAAKPETTIAIRAVLPRLDYTISNQSQSLDFSTNNAVIPTLGIKYDHFGISYGSSSGKLDDTIDVLTTSHDFQGFYYFDKQGVDFYYQDYRGYYIDRQPLLSENYYPDLQAKTYTLNYYYKIGGDNKLSAMSTPIPSSESRSSLYYVLASVSDRSLHSSKNMIPQSNLADFSDITSLNEFHLLNASLSTGAFYPMHKENWYLNPGISVGFGAPIKTYRDDLNTSYSIKVNLKASMGYSGKKYQFGMDVANDSDAFETSGENALQFHSIIVNMILLAYTF